MKKLIFCITLTVFAVAAQAEDAKPVKQTKEKATASCCMEKAGKDAKQTASAKECSGCCKETTQKVALLSPKAAAELRR